jgi:hypothetical protein
MEDSMKRKITAILLIILIFATLAYARSMRSSGVLAATASITTAEGFLTKVIIRADRATELSPADTPPPRKSLFQPG